MTYTRYSYVALYTPGMDKTQNFIYTTQKKKTLTKDNATYVRYKRLTAKKLIYLGGIID